MSLYSDTILATANLAGYWRLGEASGTTASDALGTNHGTYRNTVSLGAAGAIAGDADAAAAFNGTGWVKLPNVAAFNPSRDFTIEAWVKPVALSPGPKTIFSAGVSGVQLRCDPNIQLLKAGVAQIDSNMGALTLAVWQHVAFTMDASGNYKCYINGAQTDSSSTATTFASAGTAISFGSQNDNGEIWNGSTDEAAIYSRALTAAEVASHYAIGRGNLLRRRRRAA